MAKRHSREFWVRLVGETERGGTLEAVARRHGVRPRTLVWWRWKLGRGPRPAARKARLLPVVVRRPTVVVERAVLIELAVHDVAVRMQTGTDVQYIAALVRALRSSC